jgi:HTH-type transcriptional regulator/antitoxin HigA
MYTDTPFQPDYPVSPGEILEEALEQIAMSQAELAERTGLTKKTINEIIKAKAPVTPESALRLERVLRQPAQYWLELDSRYRESQARTQARAQLQADAGWLKQLPINKMASLGWIEKHKDPAAQLDAVLRFFGIAQVAQWHSLWGRLSVAYRKSDKISSQAEAISVWLRQGEIEAGNIPCRPFDEAQFKQTLHEIRGLSLQPDPAVFLPALIERCGACGVAVVFLPELPKMGVSGATRWLSKDKALIQLSLRYKTDDHLWFSFFHEAGHILKHGKKALYLEGHNGLDGPQEQEANDFAAHLLIPRKVFSKLRCYSPFPAELVIEWAAELGIAPGIVVGQLQHQRLLPGASQLNALKQRYAWVSWPATEQGTSP